jgi:hypothetical protein
VGLIGFLELGYMMLYGNPPRDRSRIEFATILRYFDGGFTVFSPFCILFLGLGTMVRSNQCQECRRGVERLHKALEGLQGEGGKL